jgi:hypothetical protein
MATPGQLVKAMADALGISAATVGQYDRVLAENGLRSKAGRGLSAARVTAADAANLLIAIMGSPVSGAAIKDAALTCKVYGALPKYEKAAKRRTLRLLGAKKLAALPVRHSLRDGLIALIEEAMIGTMSPDGEKEHEPRGMTIELSGPPPRADISVFARRSQRYGAMVFTQPTSKLHQKNFPAMGADLKQSRSISFETIAILADTLSGSQ